MRVLVVYVSAKVEFCLMSPAGIVDGTATVVADLALDGDSAAKEAFSRGGKLFEEIQRLLTASPLRVTEMRVLVADPLVATVRLPWTGSAANGDVESAAVRRALSRSGYDPDLDYAIRIAPAPPGHAKPVVAYPEWIVESLRQLARELGIELGYVLPVSVAAWSLHKMRGGGTLAVAGEGWISLVQRGQHQLPTIRTYPAAEDCETAVLPKIWRRLCIRQEMRIPDAQLPSAQPRAHRTTGLFRSGSRYDPLPPLIAAGLELGRYAGRNIGINGVKPRARTTPVFWMIACFVTGWAIAVAAQIKPALQKLEYLHAENARIEQSIRVKKAAAVPPKVPQELADHVHRLNVPVAQLLSALRPPLDLPVVVVSVELVPARQDSRKGVVRYSGEATEIVDMTKYVNLVASRKPYNEVKLVKHEMAKTGGKTAYRFWIEASWAY